MMFRQHRVFLVGLAAAFATSCHDATDPSLLVADIQFGEDTRSAMQVGETFRLSAAPLDRNGRVIDVECTRQFSSDDPGVASVDQDGNITAVSPGTANIIVRLNNATRALPMLVHAGGSLLIAPQVAAVTSGGTVQFAATRIDQSGRVIEDATFTWQSANNAVATVSANGVATGVSAGTTQIAVASNDGLTATASLTVTPAGVDVVTVSVEPSRASVGVGAQITLTAIVRDGSGNVLPDRVVSWQSNESAVASVSSTGSNTARVTGNAAGTATITATSEGRSGQATVTVTSSARGSLSVTPPSVTVGTGQTAQLTATIRDDAGNVISDASVSFTSNAPNIASVSANGLVTGNEPGNTSIDVSASGHEVVVPVTVTTTAVASVALSPSDPTIEVGQSIQLTATPRDANGNALDGRQVAFTSDNSAVASVSPGGVVTGADEGTARVTATSEGVSASVVVTVNAATPASITVEPTSATVTVGETVQLTATVRDRFGNVIPDATVSFTSSAPEVATVDANGEVTGRSEGEATITAASGDVSATARITVTRTPIASITVSPSSANLCPGQTTQLTVVVRDSAGRILTGRSVTFTSSNSAVATVNASGLVTAIASGAAIITAAVEGRSATAQVTVCVAAVASVTLEPASLNIGVGVNAQLVATARDSAGNVLTDRAVTFATNNAAVATVDANGRVTGVGEGNATITATSEGKSGASAITVGPPVAIVTVDPAAATIRVGETAQLTATARDGSGNLLTGRSVSFTSSDSAVATVNANGGVTAVAPGTVTITAAVEGKTAAAAIVVIP